MSYDQYQFVFIIFVPERKIFLCINMMDIYSRGDVTTAIEFPSGLNQQTNQILSYTPNLPVNICFALMFL